MNGKQMRRFIRKEHSLWNTRYTSVLFAIVFSFYLLYLLISQIILETKAVVGEEADLGVLIYIIVFHFFTVYSMFTFCIRLEIIYKVKQIYYLIHFSLHKF